MRISSELIARAKQVKLIMQFGVGLEGVDIDAATKAGIRVAQIPVTNIGVELAKRLRPFGVKIIATKRSWSSSQLDGFTDEFVDEKGSCSEIYDFAGKADIVVCCLSMNKYTEDIIDDKFLSSMRKGALLINFARGVDYDSIHHHLESGNLGGLGTDVTSKEPFNPNDKILKMNVLLTPHVAGVTERSYRSMAKVVGRCRPSDSCRKSSVRRRDC
ncbi:hypothetical protein MLD38_026345 [Melastoma candidum]|uniref:Uncharacterized protein n=1 Tax=Melastoma candidum TaxID=119954 RepID=A0ACB9NYS7_9MYRT|nr:hypothetical protein MLD38_026345 [Melastoma candidum]